MSEAQKNFAIALPFKFATLNLATESTTLTPAPMYYHQIRKLQAQPESIVSKAIAKEERLDAYTQRVATRIPRETRLYP